MPRGPIGSFGSLHSLATEKFEIRVMALSGFFVFLEVGSKLETGETENNGNRRNWKARFLTRRRSMTREPLVIWNPGYRRQGSNHKTVQDCFVTKSVKFRFGEELLVENLTEF